MLMLFQLFGVTQLMGMFNGLEEADFGEAWVGSAVEYGPLHEFGTPTMQARPHWRVAIGEVAAQISSDQSTQGQIMEGLLGPATAMGRESGGVPTIDSAGMAPIRVALMIERRVKEIIAAKGIFDTGNYRGSVASGNTHGEAFAKSVALAIDKDSVVK